MLFQLLYSSVASKAMSDAELQDILAVARRNNDKAGVTGLLLYYAPTREFFQILEGAEESVRATYEKIFRDARHRHPAILLESPARERGFAGWSMGFLPVDNEQTRAWSGFADLFGNRLNQAELTGRGTAALRFMKHIAANLQPAEQQAG